MTETPLYPLSEFTPEEAAKVAEFEAAEPTVEHMTGVLLTAILGDTDGGLVLQGDLPAEEIARLIAEVAAPAVLAVFRGQQDPAVQRVLALAESWRYKGEYGWGAWQEGHGPDPEGYILDQAAADVRAAIGGDGR